MIRKGLATILFLAAVPVCCAAQRRGEVRIDSAKPTVYLALERLEENGQIWLRLHNNTRWAINLRTRNTGADLVNATYTEAQLKHYRDKQPNKASKAVPAQTLSTRIICS